MNVAFYGHVRQYHSIKNEIDANITKVLESGQYVMGPMLKQFEAGARRLSRDEVRDRRRQRHRRDLARVHGAGHRSRATRSSPTPTPSSPRPKRSGSPAPRRSSSTATRRPSASTRRRSKRPSRRRPRPSSPCTSTASAPTCRRSARSPTSTSCSSSKTTPRPSAPRGDGFKIGELSDAVTHQLHHPEEPRHLRRRRRASSPNNADIDARGPQAAQPRLDQAHRPQLRLQQPPGRHPRRRPQRQAEAHRRVERPAPQVGGALHGGPEGRRLHRPALRDGRATATSSTSTSSRRRTPPHRDQLVDFLNENGIDAKTHYPIAIHQQEGYPWGKDARIARLPRQRRAERRLLHLPADVPRADGGGSRLRHRRRQVLEEVTSDQARSEQ